jgi:hypothetical protein
MEVGSFRSDHQPLVKPDQIQWEAPDMIVTFGADVTWTDLDSRHDLWLAVDCQGNPNATVGQLVAINSTGPLRLGYGGWRDLLLGCQFFNGRGDLITAGGKTMKNVAGYDVTKFMVGQFGVFGKLATLTARLYCKPTDAVLAEFEMDAALLNRLVASPCKPQWAVQVEQKLFCGYLGDEATVDYYCDRVPSWQPRKMERHGFEADVAWRTRHWQIPNSASGGDELSLRASVPPARLMEFVRLSRLRQWVADPVFGIVLSATPLAAANQIQEAAAAVGGRFWLWDVANQLVNFSPSPMEKTICDRIKQAIDPDRRLAALPW